MMLPGNIVSLEDLERWFIQITLASFEGDKTKAARQLGIDRRTLYRKLSAWGIHSPPKRGPNKGAPNIQAVK